MMKKTIFNKSVVSSAVSAALLISFTSIDVNAADAPAVEKGKIEKIEVTANRRAQSIQEIPYNISAVSGDELESAGIIDASDLMRNVAGITVVDRGYRNSGAVSGVIIRGVNVDGGSNGDVALSAVPTVASYINDTPMYANFILKDVEMVEVLRGPQGTLYGSGSLAGTVKYRMNRPETDEFNGSASVNLGQAEGSDGFNLNTDVMLNLPISDNFAIRANVGQIDNDGIVDYTNVYNLNDNTRSPMGSIPSADFDPTGGFVPSADYNAPATDGDLATGGNTFRSVKDADTVDITYGRISALFEATDDLKFLLAYQFQNDEIGGRRQVTRGTNWVDGTEKSYGDYENGAVLLEPSDRDVSLTSLEVEWNLGFATLTSSSSQYSHEGNSISDNTGFYAQNDWFTDLYYGTPRPLAMANRGYEEEAFVQELRLVSNERKANIDWVVGAYYMDQDTLSTQDSYMPGYQEWAFASKPAWWDTMGGYGMVYTDNDFHYIRNQSFKDTAIFGELTYHFSDKLRATVGARYFDNTFTNDTVLSLPIWPFLSDKPNFENEESDTLFKGNVSYDLSDDTMLYATYAEGYRRGGANAVPLSGALEESELWQNYTSDSVSNYEFGLKGYLDGGTHSYTVSAFLIDWQDPQLNTATSWGFFAVANGESAQTSGIELELQGYLTDDLHYVLGYAYVQAELTDDFYAPSYASAENPYALVAVDGTRLPTTPESTLNVSLDYTQSMDNNMYWITQVNGYYQSDTVNALGEGKYQADIDAFSIWGLSTRISADDWDVALYVKNVFNEDGITGVIPESAMGTDPGENFLGNASKDYISQPRTIGLSATYRF
jgi:iron complex outermembrane receptor protein